MDSCTIIFVTVWITAKIALSYNLLCDTHRISEIKGDWDYNSDDCSWTSADYGPGDIIWFGDSNGVTPDSAMNNLTGGSFNSTLTLSVTDCDGNNCNAGLLFHAKNVSTTNNGGYQYVFMINTSPSSAGNSGP